MTMQILNVVSAVCLLSGSFLALAAAIGLIRFPDVLTRMHATTKPQTMGLLLILVGIGCRIHDVVGITLLFLVATIQIVTAPISAHMISRAHVSLNPIRHDLLYVDELHNE